MCSQLQPCANGATCSDMPNNYSCACASGFDGRTCETDLDMYGHPEQLYARPFLLPPSLLFEYILLGRCMHVAGLCLNGGTCNSTGPDRLVGLRNACGAERSQPPCQFTLLCPSPPFCCCTVVMRATARRTTAARNAKSTTTCAARRNRVRTAPRVRICPTIIAATAPRATEVGSAPTTWICAWRSCVSPSSQTTCNRTLVLRTTNKNCPRSVNCRCAHNTSLCVNGGTCTSTGNNTCVAVPLFCQSHALCSRSCATRRALALFRTMYSLHTVGADVMSCLTRCCMQISMRLSKRIRWR